MAVIQRVKDCEYCGRRLPTEPNYQAPVASKPDEVVKLVRCENPHCGRFYPWYDYWGTVGIGGALCDCGQAATEKNACPIPNLETRLGN